MWKHFIRDDFSLSKRHLGIVMAAAGAGLLVFTIIADRVRDHSGTFGTTQQIVTLAAALLIVVGLTLIPLGDRPA